MIHIFSKVNKCKLLTNLYWQVNKGKVVVESEGVVVRVGKKVCCCQLKIKRKHGRKMAKRINLHVCTDT